jgi:hypothetical protein
VVPDIETDVFDAVASALSAKFGGIFITGEYVHAPESFPAVSLIEEDNSAFLPALDSEGSHHSQLMYEVNVYSNLKSGRKAQAKEIMQEIDEKMSELGFVRLSRKPMTLPNAETSIYRMNARYRTVVDENKRLLRR